MGLRSLLLATGLAFGITGFFGLAHADILTIRQNIVGDSPGTQVEITAFLAENDADQNEIVRRLRATLNEDLIRNPALLTHFEEIVKATDRSPSSVSPTDEALKKIAGEKEIIRRVLPVETATAISKKFPNWIFRNSRTIFTIARGTINSSVTTWSLVATQHLPFEVALATGVITGALSGGFQYMNEHVQKYLTTSLAEKLVKGQNLKKGTRFVESLFRWYAMEVGFVAVIQVTLAAMGHPPPGTFLGAVGTNLTSALKAVAAQGLWDVAVSKITNRGMGVAKNAAAKSVIRFRSDLMTLGLSALSVTGMIGQLAGLPFGDTIFLAMGTTGGIVLAKVIYNEWRCRRNFSAPTTPEKMDSLTGGGSGQTSDDS